MTTLYTAIAILGMGAIIGMYMLSLILTDNRPPKSASFIHGVFALAGAGLLIYYCTKNAPSPFESLIVLIIAAMMGLMVWWKEITGQKIPKWLTVLHGLTAVGGYTLLLVFAFM